MEVDYLLLSREFLDLTHSLAEGPNKYKSKFGKILEGVFRKDYFTLQTIIHLVDLSKKYDGLEVIIAGSVVDLSRRVLEDMIYMQYIKEKGSLKYSEQFIHYANVERKRDLDFLIKAGVVIDDKKRQEIDDQYEKVQNKLKSRDNWAGQSFEQILLWFVEVGKIKDSEKETILGLYTIGNRKNHTSSSDIIGHNLEETLLKGSNIDINAGLMIVYGSIVKSVLLFIDEVEVNQDLKDRINMIWDSLQRLS